MVQDPSAGNTGGLLELKYIQMENNESLDYALIRQGICKKYDDGVKLTVRHKYHFQMQQIMFVAERKWIDFAVMGDRLFNTLF